LSGAASAPSQARDYGPPQPMPGEMRTNLERGFANHRAKIVNLGRESIVAAGQKL
jgi:hypothetical protein